MKKLSRITLGHTGEEKAAEFLRQIGFKILEKNFKTPYGELDIIAEDKNTLVFVEVKTRRSLEFGEPEEAITNFKKDHLIKSALFFISTLTKNRFGGIRFDAVSIKVENVDFKIQHIKDIISL